MIAEPGNDESDRADGHAVAPSSGSSPSPEPVINRCYRHPMREALVRCTRCDRPICPDCMRPASVGFHCPDDVKLANREVRGPRTSVGAPVRSAATLPYVTWTLLALNIGVYLITALSPGGEVNDPRRSTLFSNLFLSPYLVAHNHQFIRLIGSAFLHIGLLHIAANMFALWVIGPHLERVLGWWRYLALYLLAGFGGGVAVYTFGARGVDVVGASGAIFGLFAASLLFVRELGFDRRYLIFTIVMNFVLTFSIANISKLGHVGGFVVGGAVAFALAGVPWARRRVPVVIQLAGMGAILLVLLAAVFYRTSVLG
jgi:membrane associated rhomboid family serine protease